MMAGGWLREFTLCKGRVMRLIVIVFLGLTTSAQADIRIFDCREPSEPNCVRWPELIKTAIDRENCQLDMVKFAIDVKKYNDCVAAVQKLVNERLSQTLERWKCIESTGKPICNPTEPQKKTRKGLGT